MSEAEKKEIKKAIDLLKQSTGARPGKFDEVDKAKKILEELVKEGGNQ